MEQVVTYTKEEVIEFAENLGKLYKYDWDTKTWNMQTNLAPGMLHETSAQLLDRLIDSEKRWKAYLQKSKNQ